MKRRLVILLVAWLFVPVAMMAVNYTLSFNRETPEEAFQSIKKVTGYEFVYNKILLSAKL